MPRPRSLNPTDRLNFAIDKDLKARLELVLYSDLEQRVPKGAWQAFIEARIREWFEWQRADLHPYGFPEGYFVVGPKAMVESVLKEF